MKPLTLLKWLTAPFWVPLYIAATPLSYIFMTLVLNEWISPRKFTKEAYRGFFG